MFANKYLQKQNKKALIAEPPHVELGIIIVIPCFNEPEIIKTLESLFICEKPDKNVEVILLINHSEISSTEIKQFNHQTETSVKSWLSKNRSKKISFTVAGPVELRKKWAGAGLARKTGMDEAVLRFNILDNRNGIIVSLDADTLVDKNYLVEIEKHFKTQPKEVGATICFEHQKRGLNPRHLEGIELYEKYLQYYKTALEYTGYPYSMFTIGSAFAVTADAYVKRGGMNRRQAGEDFYFLQNLVQIGKVGEIRTTKVYPSARLSSRVPFGTGPVLIKWMNGEEDLNTTYHFQAFIDLKHFFRVRKKLFKVDKNGFDHIVFGMPESVKKFLQQDNFWEEISELSRNCSKPESFQTRFFYKFNAFKILKFLNYAHEFFYKKADLEEQLTSLKKVKYPDIN